MLTTDPPAPVPAAVVFDFDGLILDTEWTGYLATAAVFEAHGEELSLELWTSFVGTTDHPHWTDILESQLGEPIDRDRWRPIRRADGAARASELELLPGVVELLDALAGAGVPLAVASSSPDDWVRSNLEHRQLLERFEVICTGDEVALSKPDPALYRLACERLGVEPGDSVALEDSAHGVESARAAGMAVVAVPSSLTEQLDFSGADLIVSSCAELDPTTLAAVLSRRITR